MPSRAEDWLKQAMRDLELARSAAEHAFHEWACFASQHAAEKAVKALLQHAGASARGHSVRGLLEALPESVEVTEDLQSGARELDRHYIPARYPNSVPAGAPYESYDGEQSERAIAAADRIVGFCRRNLA